MAVATASALLDESCLREILMTSNLTAEGTGDQVGLSNREALLKACASFPGPMVQRRVWAEYSSSQKCLGVLAARGPAHYIPLMACL
jgi:hypothetical protein